jgi:Skp family chaperone for outer membrane proteins
MLRTKSYRFISNIYTNVNNQLQEGYKEVPLKAVMSVCKDTQSKDFETYQYIDLAGVHEGKITPKLVSRSKLPGRALYKVRVGDIIYGTIRPNQLHYAFIRDEDIKEKNKKELTEKINKLCESKVELIKKLRTFLEKEKIKKNEMIYPFVQSLGYILCKELISISFFFEKLKTSDCKEKMNSNKLINIKSIYEKFKNDFSAFIRNLETKIQRDQRFLQLKKREIEKNINALNNEIKQKEDENRTLQNKYPRPPSQGMNMGSRGTSLRRIDDDIKRLKRQINDAESHRKPDGSLNGYYLRELQTYQRQLEEKISEREEAEVRQTKLNNEQRDYKENQQKIKENETRIQMCKAEKDSLTEIKNSLELKFKDKKKEFNDNIDRIKSLYEGINNIMSIFNKVENKTNEIQKKTDELKKKNFFD